MTVSITSGQRTQILRLAEDAARQFVEGDPPLNLARDQAQRVIEKGDELQRRLRTAFRDAVIDLAEFKYAHELVASNHRYGEHYTGPASVEDQLTVLTKHFGGDPTPTLRLAASLPPLPEDVEGWFVTVKPSKLGSINATTERVLEALAATRPFRNYREGALGPDRYRLTDKTAKALSQLETDQEGDFLLLPAQFGLKWRGSSIRRDRELITLPEFGLPAFVTGSMLLSNPERLTSSDDLAIDNVGDEYDYSADGSFDDASFFRFGDGALKFSTRWVGNAIPRWGGASGFLLQL